MANDKITIQFDGDVKQLRSKLDGLDKKTKSVGKGFGAKIASGAKAMAVPLAAAAAAIVAIGASVGGLVREAAKIEDITTQFEVLTGSASAASKVVKDLQNFSASTPFQFEGIAKASQQLLGFGFSAEELVPRLKEIGDVASAVGKPIEEVGFIFGQVAAAGKLTGERLLQFQERAIPIGPAIAKTMGIAETAVKAAVTAGKVDLETFQKAFASLSQSGGFAFEGMIKQSKTFNGLLSTVGDNVSILAAEIGKELLPVAKSLATAFLKLLTATRNFLKEDDDAAEKRVKSLREEYARLENGIKSLQDIERQKAAEGKELNSLLENRLKNHLARKAEIQAEFDQQDKDKADEKAAAERTRLKAEEDQKTMILEEARKARAALLTELETELAETEFESAAARQQRLQEIVQKNLDGEFDAKRAVAKDDIKNAIKENKLRMKEEVKYGKELAKAKSFFRSEEFKGTQAGLQAIMMLSQTGNKTLGRIAKVAAMANAVMNTAQGVTNALANVPYPLNFAAAASVGIAGAAQIATIASTGFAKGGMVEGGIPGKDSVNATLMPGEIVAPRKNFDEVIGSVRAQREAANLTDESAASSSTVVEISLKDNIGEFIEATILERRVLGVGAV